MSDPRPVKFTAYAASDGTYAAEPLKVIGPLPTGSVSAATTSVAGVVKKTPARADSAALTAAAAAGATPTKAEYDALLADVTALHTVVNDLLAKLRTAGIVTA